jgi:hypothetical protein
MVEPRADFSRVYQANATRETHSQTALGSRSPIPRSDLDGSPLKGFTLTLYFHVLLRAT